MNLSSRYSLLALLVILTIGWIRAENEEISWKGFSVSCLGEDETSNATAACHGVKLVRKIVQKMLEEARKRKSIEIIDGISLVESQESVSRDARFLKNLGQLGSIVNFLQKRELRIKLRSLLPDNFENVVGESREKGRGKGGKKGDSTMIIIVMAKMMVAMGFGALGLLAMKALMVASLALMLSLIVAAKKLAGQQEESHHIVYAQQEHHRRRRGLDYSDIDYKNQPYRGYAPLSDKITKT